LRFALYLAAHCSHCSRSVVSIATPKSKETGGSIAKHIKEVSKQ